MNVKPSVDDNSKFSERIKIRLKKDSKRSVDDKSTLWIGLIKTLLIVLFGLNLLIFTVYYGAHPSENIWIQLWNYFDSSIFKIITVSLIFPIILATLERRFKFLETMRKNRMERARKEIDNRRLRRLEGIKLTTKMWNDLYELISDIIYLGIDNNKKDNKKIDKKEESKIIQKKLHKFISSAHDIMIIWEPSFNTPWEKKVNELFYEAQDLFFQYTNILFHSAKSVACLMGESNDKDSKDLINSICLIQHGIEYIAYERIVLTLQNFMKLAEFYEDPYPEDEKKKKIKRKNELFKAIKDDLKYLQDKLQPIKEIEEKHINVLHFVKGKEVKSFREKAKEIKKWLKNNPKKFTSDFKDYNDFQSSYKKIPHEKLVEKTPIYYSLECIRHLADHLYFVCNCIELEYNRKYF